MNEFARILLRCYSDSWEDKVPGPKPRSEEEMPPSIKVTKLKLKQNFLRWAVDNKTWLRRLWLIWFVEKLRSILTMLSNLTLIYILQSATMNLHWRRFEFQILKYIAFRCCFMYDKTHERARGCFLTSFLEGSILSWIHIRSWKVHFAAFVSKIL